MLLQPPVRRWVCPRCEFRDVTRSHSAHTRFHRCSGLRGLTAPMVLEGTRAELRAVEREDFVGRERVTTDEAGRPVMAVVTTRDEGEDCTVFAPVATVSADGVGVGGGAGTGADSATAQGAGS